MTFTRSLDFIINNLEDMKKIRQFCRRLGRSHVNYIERGFKPEYWDIFAESLTECAIDWEGGQRCRDILIGWRTLINFVIEEMRISFVKERRARSSSVCVSDSPNGSAASSTTSTTFHSTDFLHTKDWDSEVLPMYFDNERPENRRRATSLQPQHRCPFNVK
uniref:Globin family profile domain-containing protein n=1 Tax=Panagrolaimus davidi TaxID=227884 RepID=A0A914PD79_9BILA